MVKFAGGSGLWIALSVAAATTAGGVGYWGFRPGGPMRDTPPDVPVVAAMPGPGQIGEAGSAPDGSAEADGSDIPVSGSSSVVGDVTAQDTGQPVPDVGAIEPPAFDLVRIDGRGGAVIAGTAPAGFTVDVEVDGVVLAATPADDLGTFVALFDMEPTASAQVVSLVARGPNGVSARSRDSAILTPSLPSARPDAQGYPTPEATAAVAATAAARALGVATGLQGTVEPLPVPVGGPAPVAIPATNDRAAPLGTELASGEGPAAERPPPATAVAVPTAPTSPDANVDTAMTSANPVVVGTGAVPVAAIGPDASVAFATATDSAQPVAGVSSAGIDPTSERSRGTASSQDVATPRPAQEVLTVATPAIDGVSPAPSDAAGASAAVELPRSAGVLPEGPGTRAIAETSSATAASHQQGRPLAAVSVATESQRRVFTSQAMSEQVAAAQIAPETAPKSAAETVQVSGQAPAVLLAGQSGIRLLQPSQTQASPGDRIAIDVISYSETGDVLLEGRSRRQPPDAPQVLVYLNNQPLESVKISDDGRWRTPLPKVDAGVYTLRVDQVSDDGVVVSRFETPFKREDPNDLARLTPSAEATDGVSAALITVQPGYTLWGIASDRYGDGLRYVQVFEANKDLIRNPDLIYPGQVFELPEN